MTWQAGLLLFASAVAVAGVLVIVRGDLRNDPRHGPRVIVEALIPVIGLATLLWWSWSAL